MSVQDDHPEDENIEDEDEVLDEDEDIEDEEDLPEDLSSNNNEVVKSHDNIQDNSSHHPKLAMPTPILAQNTMAALAASMSRQPHQPHFLAASIAAMAAAAQAAQANNSQAAVTSSTTATTSSASLPIFTNGGASPWPPTPPGHPGPPLGFPFGIPGLRHPLFTSGMLGMCLVSVLGKTYTLYIIGRHCAYHLIL